MWLCLLAEPTQIYRFLRTRNLIAVSVSHMINLTIWDKRIFVPLGTLKLDSDTSCFFISPSHIPADILAQDAHLHVPQKLKE